MDGLLMFITVAVGSLSLYGMALIFFDTVKHDIPAITPKLTPNTLRRDEDEWMDIDPPDGTCGCDDGGSVCLYHFGTPYDPRFRRCGEEE